MSRAQLTSTVEQNTGGAVAPFVAGKNFIINGDMRIWQRGTSFTGGLAYTADRWTVSGSGTVSQQTFTAGSAPVAGYEAPYYLNWTVSSNQQYAEIVQRVEDVRVLAGQTATLSFWARSTVGSQTMNVNIYQDYGSGGSSLNGTSLNGTFTPTSTWTRYTFTGAIPSIAGKTIGTGSFLWVRIAQLTTTATNTSLDIWGVQLEAGSVATPFTTASNTVQGELALCQRYYYTPIYGNPTSTGATFGPISQNAQNINGFAGLQFPVSMRTAPTLTLYSNGTANYVRQTSNGAQNYLGASPTVYVLNNNGYAAIISASASLTTGVMYDWTYTVSAEL